MPNKDLNNEAWEKLIEKYDIINQVKNNGVFKIKSKQINEFRQSRIMSKFDTSEKLPKVFKDNGLNILPDSRRSYVIGQFSLYEEIPEEKDGEVISIPVPDFETINANNISTETQAINVLIISKILDDFLETPENIETFNGRMGTGRFDYDVETKEGSKIHIDVDRAQCEIDGGFENEDSVVILEAKNVINKDFHVRQLYYPYRLWKSKVNKPIRLVFSIYSNMLFRLFEYEFNDENDYSSIKLLKTKNYCLDKQIITQEDLVNIRTQTTVVTNDNQKDTNTPFPQADSFERVVSLLENLKDNPLSTEEIADLMQFELRQSDYYYNAGKYLGLFEKKNRDGIKVYLTKTGDEIFNLNYKQRQLALARQILKHQIFTDLFNYYINQEELPNKNYVINLMKRYNVCNKGELMNRRASTVLGWARWIINLIDK